MTDKEARVGVWSEIGKLRRVLVCPPGLAHERLTPDSAEELQRAKAYLKGSLLLSLESTTNRMSNLARQEIFFGRFFAGVRAVMCVTSGICRAFHWGSTSKGVSFKL